MAFVNMISLELTHLLLLLLFHGYGFYELEYAVSNSEDPRNLFFRNHWLRKRAIRSDITSKQKQNTAIRGFDFGEQVNMTRKHNELRRRPYASDMKRMTWDEELRKMSQLWADNCDFRHSSDSHRSTPTFPYAGENLYVGTGSYNEEQVIQLWYDEVDDYNYNSLQCVPGKMCGHYTQIVWADTYKVGCGIRHCEWTRTIEWKNAYLVVCNYAPGGNYRGMRPYKQGRACSRCSGNHTLCSDNLCSNSTCFGDVCLAEGTLLTDVCMCECQPGFSGPTCSADGVHFKRRINLLAIILAMVSSISIVHEQVMSHLY